MTRSHQFASLPAGMPSSRAPRRTAGGGGRA